jgi:hypothetical protein
LFNDLTGTLIKSMLNLVEVSFVVKGLKQLSHLDRVVFTYALELLLELCL